MTDIVHSAAKSSTCQIPARGSRRRTFFFVPPNLSPNPASARHEIVKLSGKKGRRRLTRSKEITGSSDYNLKPEPHETRQWVREGQAARVCTTPTGSAEPCSSWRDHHR